MKRNFCRAVSVLGCASLLLSCGNSGGQKDSGTEPLCVSVMEVKKSEDISLRSYVGKVEASQNMIVATRIPGTVESVNVKKGSRVKVGDVIAVIKSESVDAAYKAAQATLEQAQDGYGRLMRLQGNGNVTEVQRVETQTRLRQAEAAFSAAEAAVEQCRIKAPYSGVIGEMFIERGADIPLSAPVARLLNVSDVEIHFSVPENEIASVRTGSSATVEVTAVGRTVPATVAVKGVDASLLSHCYGCVLVPGVPCPDILPGMVCKVRLRDDRGSAIIVPMRSVKTDASGRYVWCVDTDGTVLKKHIVCGGFATDGVIVSGGLREGDRLVVEGQRIVSSGMKVNVKVL